MTFETLGRYRTLPKKLELFSKHILDDSGKPSKYVLQLGAGPRMAYAHACGGRQIDVACICPDYIRDMKEVLRNWQKYKNIEPLNVEAKFFEERGFGEPDINRFRFYLVYLPWPELPRGEKPYDIVTGWEMWFYMSEELARNYWRQFKERLASKGRAIMTIYPSGYENSLEHLVLDTAEAEGIAKDGIYDSKKNVLYLNVFRDRLEGKQEGLSEKYKVRFWLDVFDEKVPFKLYAKGELVKQAKSEGFALIEQEDITGGGMFPDAKRRFVAFEKIEALV